MTGPIIAICPLHVANHHARFQGLAEIDEGGQGEQTQYQHPSKISSRHCSSKEGAYVWECLQPLTAASSGQAPLCGPVALPRSRQPNDTDAFDAEQVIRALYDYEAQNPQELGFSRGDFFHVIGRENDPDWYEACNPALPDARGLVPVAFFQALGRTERDSAQSQPDSARSAKHPDHDSGYGDASATPAASQRNSKAPGKSGAMVYGVVIYDFHAERGDELEAKAGEAIIVIAQSNPEWFVAKPIGRLGGPGLIPVSFIEIRDMASNTPVANPQDAVRRAGIPKVEEWKKMAADYKNSSITLGKFDVAQPQVEQGMERMSIQQPNGRASQVPVSNMVSLGLVT